MPAISIAQASSTPGRALGLVVTIGLMLAYVSPAASATYKCKNAAGKTEYTDQPCDNKPDTKPWTPKQPLNVMSKDAVTGQAPGSSAPPDKKPAWLKGPSPVSDCKAKGGTFDPEFRACRLP